MLLRSAAMQFLLLPLSLLCAATAAAQETTGDLRGRIVSGRGDVTGAEIRVIGNSLRGTRTVTSNSDGAFVALSLPPGQYTLRIRAIGFRPLVVDSVVVHL